MLLLLLLLLLDQLLLLALCSTGSGRRCLCSSSCCCRSRRCSGPQRVRGSRWLLTTSPRRGISPLPILAGAASYLAWHELLLRLLLVLLPRVAQQQARSPRPLPRVLLFVVREEEARDVAPGHEAAHRASPDSLGVVLASTTASSSVPRPRLQAVEAQRAAADRGDGDRSRRIRGSVVFRDRVRQLAPVVAIVASVPIGVPIGRIILMPCVGVGMAVPRIHITVPLVGVSIAVPRIRIAVLPISVTGLCVPALCVILLASLLLLVLQLLLIVQGRVIVCGVQLGVPGAAAACASGGVASPHSHIDAGWGRDRRSQRARNQAQRWHGCGSGSQARRRDGFLRPARLSPREASPKDG